MGDKLAPQAPPANDYEGITPIVKAAPRKPSRYGSDLQRIVALIRYNYPSIPEPLDLITYDEDTEPPYDFLYDKFVTVWHELEWILATERL